MRAMSESMAIKHQELVMFVAHITLKERGDIPGWGSHWGPYGYLGAVQNWSCPSLTLALWKLVPSLASALERAALYLIQAAQ